MSEQPTPLVWFLDDVAAETRLPKSTLRDWRYRRIGPPSFKLGRHVAYRPEDVRAWIDAQAADAVGGQ